MQLIINTFGASLRKQGERFLVKAGDRELAVSVHKVQSILITTGAHLTTDAIELAVAHNVDVLFLSQNGEPYARVWQTRMGSTATIRRRQLEVAEGPEGLALVADWVQAKLRHQAEFLEELHSTAGGSAAVRESAGDHWPQSGRHCSVDRNAGRAAWPPHGAGRKCGARLLRLRGFLAHR